MDYVTVAQMRASKNYRVLFPIHARWIHGLHDVHRLHLKQIRTLNDIEQELLALCMEVHISSKVTQYDS